VRSVFADLPEHSTILYVDTDLALMQALLSGAGRLGAIPYPMIRNSPRRNQILETHKPDFLVLIPPRALSGYSAVRSRTMRRRFYGYDFREFERIEVSSASITFQHVLVRFERPVRPDQISVSLTPAKGNRGKSSCNTALSGKPELIADGWHRFGADGCAFEAITIAASSPANAVTGLRFAETPDDSAWPWGRNGTALRTISRNNRRVDVDFSWSALFAVNHAPKLEFQLDGMPIIVGDKGGLILARIKQR
jgi:hypothetical protein